MSIVTTELEIVNLANSHLGQSKISATVYAAQTDPNAVTMSDLYNVTRRAMLRQFPFEFARETLPMVQVAQDGLIVVGCGTAEANGAYTYANSEWTLGTAAKVSGSSGAWVMKSYEETQWFTSTDAVDYPWLVSAWIKESAGTVPVPRVYAGAPTEYAYLYKLPTDCIAPWGILNPATRSVDYKIRFRPFKGSYLACDADGAVLIYTRDVTDVSEMDDLFVNCFALSLAIAAHNDIKNSLDGRQKLQMELNQMLLLCKNIDAATMHEDVTQTTGRRYIDV